jgi:hypothetical protein
MTNFENIEVGDKVLIPVYVSYGWGSGRTFYIEKAVTRITNTQFLVGELRFR